MAGQGRISWTDNQSNQLRKSVKNFNAKVTRLEKKYDREIAKAKSTGDKGLVKQLTLERRGLPERVTMKEIKNVVKTRNDLQREVRALQRFTKRGSEKMTKVPVTDNNIFMTEWQSKEMTRRISYINKRRAERRAEIADLEVTSRGQKVGYKRGEFGMGKANERQLAPMNAFTEKMDYADLHKKFKSIRKESSEFYWNWRELILKENYKNSILENFRQGDVKEILETIDNMDFGEFYKIFEADANKFETSYPKDDREYQMYLSALKATWLPNKEKKAG